jgi:hypothetical protein
VSNLATFGALAGAFGAGSAITAGVKSQFDRVEKFRDRQIQAAEEFLTKVGDVQRIQRDAHSAVIRAYGAGFRLTAGPLREGDDPLADLDVAMDELDTLRVQAADGLAELSRTLPRLSVIFSRRSITGTVRHWPSVEAEAEGVGDALAGVNLALDVWVHVARREGRFDDGSLKDATTIEVAILHAEQKVKDASVALNRAVRRRWRV